VLDDIDGLRDLRHPGDITVLPNSVTFTDEDAQTARLYEKRRAGLA
jgi:hypothetical protein